MIASDAFARWYETLEQARERQIVASKKHDELLTQVNLLEFRAELAHRNAIDTLERANVLGDASVALENEAAELENASFEVVSQFEMQRDRTTRLWETLGAIDVELEEGHSDQGRLRKKRERVNEDYEREAQRKQKLWQEVEKLWVRSINANLALREKRVKADLVRREAEELFQKHEREAQKAEALKRDAEAMAKERDQAERAAEEAAAKARETFGCLLTDDFLYWLSRETNKVVYAVPLVEDAVNYVVPVAPGKIYRCDATRGIDTLELVDDRETSAESPAAASAAGDDESGQAESAAAGPAADEG